MIMKWTPRKSGLKKMVKILKASKMTRMRTCSRKRRTTVKRTSLSSQMATYQSVISLLMAVKAKKLRKLSVAANKIKIKTF